MCVWVIRADLCVAVSVCVCVCLSLRVAVCLFVCLCVCVAVCLCTVVVTAPCLYVFDALSGYRVPCGQPIAKPYQMVSSVNCLSTLSPRTRVSDGQRTCCDCL